MVAILVILTILLLVIIDAVLLSGRKRRVLTASPRLHALRAELPAGLFLHAGHGWVQVNTDGTAEIGVDDFVRQAVGAPDSIVTRPPGTWLSQGESMLGVEQAGKFLTIQAPLSGRIEAVREELSRHPDWWPTSPENGWAYTVTPFRLGTEVRRLRLGDPATAWLREQKARLGAWLAESSGGAGIAATTLPDGGEPAWGALRQMDEPSWAEFERCFLSEEDK
jgi:glycine cleavage system H lipoate-binding protein